MPHTTFCGLVFSAALMMAGVAPALAHSFELAFVVQAADRSADGRHPAYDGFRFATKERDAHADEEADGHLGGLDVYIRVLDVADDGAALESDLAALVQRYDIKLVTALADPALEATVKDMAQGMGAVYVPGPVGEIVAAETMDGAPFATAFTADYGYTPTQVALRGYDVARVVDRLIRRLGEDLDDRALVEQTLQDLLKP